MIGGFDPELFFPRVHIVRLSGLRDDRIVITGIGIVAAVGGDREAVWRAMQAGKSGISRLTGVAGIPDRLLLGATVDVPTDFPGQLKNIPLTRITAAEALIDSGIELDGSKKHGVDRDRFGCSIGAHMGDDNG